MHSAAYLILSFSLSTSSGGSGIMNLIERVKISSVKM